MTNRHSSNRHVVGTAGRGWLLLETRSKAGPDPIPGVISQRGPGRRRPGPGRTRRRRARSPSAAARFERIAGRILRAWRMGDPGEVIRLCGQLDAIPAEVRGAELDRRLQAARRWAHHLTGTGP